MSKKLLFNNPNNSGDGNAELPVTDGLVCWLDAKDLSNGDTVWKDRSTRGNDATLTGFTFDETNGIVNPGKIKMKQGAKISLPSQLRFQSIYVGYTDGNIDDQIDIIGTKPRTARFCLRYGDYYPYPSQLSMAKAHNFPLTNDPYHGYFGRFLKSFPIETFRTMQKNLYLQFSTNNIHQNPIIGYDTNSKANTEYSFILIYNRPLSEEEINLLFDYETKIERG